MPAFGVEVEGCKEIGKFVNKTNERLQVGNLVTNPFTDSMLLNMKNTIVVYMKPIYLNFPIYGLCLMLPTVLYFKGFTFSYWLIPCLVFLAVSLFWSRYFLYPLMKLGLRKAGYKGKLKLLKSEETIRRLIEYGSNRSP